MAAESLLHFNGANGSTVITDDTGRHGWTAFTTAISTTQNKFGGSSMRTSGSGGGAQIATASNAIALGQGIVGPWTAEWFFNMDSATQAGNATMVIINRNAGSSVGAFTVHYTTNNIKWSLSSNGSSSNIASLTAGTKVAYNATQWYHCAITYDNVAGKYYGYIDGVKDFELASSTEVWVGPAPNTVSGHSAVGFNPQGGTQFLGYIDEFYVDTSCLYPGGTTFTPRTSEIVLPLVITPVTGSIALTGAAPVFINQRITPNTGTISLTGAAPTITVPGVITPGTGALSFTGQSPALTIFTPPTTSGSLVLHSLKGFGVTVQTGVLGTVKLRSMRGDGQFLTPNVFYGTPKIRSLKATGSMPVPVKLAMRKLAVNGRFGSAFAGALVLKSLKANSIAGTPSLRKLQISGTFSATLAQTYRTFVFNTSNRAVTEYQNYRFNSYARIGGNYYGAGPDGFIKLDGTTDAGANINWSLRTGQLDDKDIKLKRLPEVVMGLRASGPIRVRVRPDDNTFTDYMLPAINTQTLRQQRVKCGKGVRGRYFAVELQGVNNATLELDSMQVNMTSTTRRIG